MNNQTLELEYNYSPLLPNNKNARILDAGCGHGRILNFLYEKGYQNLLGVDRDKEALEKISPKLKEKVVYATDLLVFLQNTKEKFDLIIAKDVIYYFENKDLLEVLLKMNDSLNDNGMIFVEIFNGAILTGPYIKYKDLFIKGILTEQSITAAMELSDFKITHSAGIKIPVTGLRSALYFLINSLWKLALKTIYFAERGLDQQNPTVWDKKFYRRKKINGKG